MNCMNIIAATKPTFPDDKFTGTKGVMTAFRVLGAKDGVVADESAANGVLFSSESYMFLIKYDYKNEPRYILYFWQGRTSSAGQKGASALVTMDLTVLGVPAGNDFVPPTHVYISEGRETHTFASFFPQRICVVLSGKFRSAVLPKKPADDALLIKIYNISTCRTKTACEVLVYCLDNHTRFL